ncbi:MAG: hypothetical protein N3C59_02310 [Azovibrio sp.]|nr:hypothetical protein [Azovibrio sp.]
MHSQTTQRQDGLLAYVESLTTLRQKIESVRAKQEAALAELLAIREKCQALRLALRRAGG